MVQVLDPLHSGLASGSYADITHQRHRGRHIVKVRSGPKVNTSAKRLQHRGIVALAAAAWRALTSDQRDLWRDYAQTFPLTDPFGRKLQANGYHVFVSSSIIRLRYFLNPLPSPRSDLPLPLPHTRAWIHQAVPPAWFVQWQWTEAPPDFEGYSETWTARVDSPGATPLITSAQYYKSNDWQATLELLDMSDPGCYHVWTRSVDIRSGRYSELIKAQGVHIVS